MGLEDGKQKGYLVLSQLMFKSVNKRLANAKGYKINLHYGQVATAKIGQLTKRESLDIMLMQELTECKGYSRRGPTISALAMLAV